MSSLKRFLQLSKKKERRDQFEIFGGKRKKVGHIEMNISRRQTGVTH
jgi:hypothetical protein